MGLWTRQASQWRARGLLGRLSGFPESALLGLIVLISLLMFSPLNTPVLQRDEGVFVYIGKGILRGEIPYRDMWDHKGPLIYYINALGLWISQSSLWGIWLVEALMLACSLVLLYLLLRRTLGLSPALFGILAWLAGFMLVLGGNIVEEYAILPAVLSVYLVMFRPRFAAAYAGALAGVLFMLRPNEIAAPVLALAFLLVDPARARDWQPVWRSLLQFMFAFALVPALFVAYFARNGALGDFFNGVFLFNLYYVSDGSSPLPALLAGLGYLILPVVFSVASIAAVIVRRKAVLSGEQKQLFSFATVLLVLTLPLSVLSGRVYRHYYVPWLLPLAVLSAYLPFFLDGSLIAPRRKRGLGLLAWSVLLMGALISIRIRAVPLLSSGAAPGEPQAVQSIQAFVPEDRQLFIWGNETGYAALADRRFASRYLYLIPVLTPGYGEGAAAQLLADIEAKRPVIIDTSPADPDTPSLREQPSGYAYLGALYAFIHEHYHIVGTITGKNWVVWGPD